MIQILDNNLRHYADIIKKQCAKTIIDLPGTAGGFGAGLVAFLNGELKKGIDMVIEYSGLEEKVKMLIWFVLVKEV